MSYLRMLLCATALAVLAMPVYAADDILDAIDQSKKSYQRAT